MRRPSRRLTGLTALAAVFAVAPLPFAVGSPDPVAAQRSEVRALAEQLSAGYRTGPGLDGVAVPVAEFRQVEADAQQLVKGAGGQSVPVRIAPAATGGSLETLDGLTVLRGDDSTWRYAVRAADGAVVPSAAVVDRDAPPAGLTPGVGRREPDQVSPQQAAQAQGHAELLRQAQIASLTAQQASASVGEPRVFNFPVLLLSTWWDSAAGQTGPQFQEGSNTPEHFTKILDGFGGNPTGTLTEFYFEDSFGTFLVKVDVLGPYVSYRSQAEDECYYGGISPGDDERTDLDLLDDTIGVGGGGALGMALEATPQADPEVDFTKYDNDGNGVVDFVGIVHSGADMAVTGDPCNTWSHAIQATLANAIVEGAAGLEPGTLGNRGIPTSDGVFLDRLFTMPEFDEPGSQLAIGVAAHEMAHALGEPDYYNTAYTSAGTGNFDIMAGGSYGGNPSGSNPIGFNPASRVFQGWITPTVVTDDLRQVSLQPRHVRPAGFDPREPSPSLLLVPVQEYAVGEQDSTGHVWTDNDVYGLAQNPRTEKYVVEGYYIENASRTASRASIDPGMTRSPYFDRAVEGSGLLVWHFDYWLRSNVYFGSNNAQTDANRPQLDLMEFDFNDNTQELQLNKGRGNADDALFSAATGITSGTRLLPPGSPAAVEGAPSEPVALSGLVPPTQTADSPFTVPDNPADRSMTVAVTGTGDCTLQLLKDGKPLGAPVDSGFVGAEEIIVVADPQPGDYIARVGDFAACTTYEGSVTFAGSDGVLETKGAADTWSNWTGKPTGWAFTNVGPASASGLDHAADGGGDEAITLDVVQLGADDSDVSPGFVTGAANALGGTSGVTAGVDNAMTVPVFNNGGKAVDTAEVVVREGSATGPVVARGTLRNLAGYSRHDFGFTWSPSAEGPRSLVVTTVAVGDAVTNDVQASELWVGPSAPRVLVVDDDGALDQEVAIAGALSALGVPYALTVEHPDAATLARYEAVVWEASQDRAVGQLDAGDVAALTEYLAGGGRLLVTSNRVIDALATPLGRTNPGASENGASFAGNYLGAQASSTGPSTKNEDVAATTAGLLGQAALTITQSPGRHFLGPMSLAEGELAPFGTAEPVVTADGAPAGDHLGVAVTGDAEHGAFRTVTLGYNLAQHTRSDQTTALVGEVLDFFGVTTAAPGSRTEPLIYHSAVRNQVSGRPVDVRAVVLGGQPDPPVTLFYRRHAQGGYHEVAMTLGSEPGSYAAVIPGNAVTPDGVDYFLRAGAASTYDPVGARDGSVVHAIAVAIPEVANPAAVLPPTAAAAAAAAPRALPARAAWALPATGLAPWLGVVALVLFGVAWGGRRLTRRPAGGLG